LKTCKKLIAKNVTLGFERRAIYRTEEYIWNLYEEYC